MYQFLAAGLFVKLGKPKTSEPITNLQNRKFNETLYTRINKLNETADSVWTKTRMFLTYIATKQENNNRKLNTNWMDLREDVA